MSYKEKLEEFKKQVAEELKEFKIDEILTKTILEKEVEGLGVVRYGKLTIADLIDIQKYENDLERGLRTVYLMLKKANPDLTFEQVKQLPIDIALKLITALGEELSRQTGFFAKSKVSRGG